MAAALAASLPVTARAMSGHSMGGFAGGGPRGSFQHGSNHQFVSRHNFGGHRFVFHDQFFRDHRRFFVGFDFMIGFGSREAIRTFQTAQGLSATGLIDPALLKALKLPAVPAHS